MTRSRVDLPPPLGPSSAVSEPLGISTETSVSAAKSPKFLFTSRTMMLMTCSSFGRRAWLISRARTAVSTSRTAQAYAVCWSKFW